MSCRDLNFDLPDRSCDTLTYLSKPVKTSKEWLISSVRILSRIYAKKGEGQDGVWSKDSKPDWWDREVELQWRNPTGKSKDTVEDLKTKYEALVRKLREENRFPIEFDDEARLWDEGKVDELFQLISEKNLLENLKMLIYACSIHVDKYGLFNQAVNSKILIEINNLLKCIKVQSNPEPHITEETETQISPITLESPVSLDTFISNSTKKCNSVKQKIKSSASCTKYKKQRHTPSGRNKSLDLQTQLNPSSSHRATYIIEKFFTNKHSADISHYPGSEKFVTPAVCSSTNCTTINLRAAESTVKLKRGTEYPDLDRFSHEDLDDAIIPESLNAVENNFHEKNKNEKLQKRKSLSDVVNITHWKKRCDSSFREMFSILNVQVGSKSCQNSFINLTKKDNQIEELNTGDDEKTDIFNGDTNEDDLSTPTQSSTDESREDPLLENIYETFTRVEKDFLFSENSQEVADLFLELPVGDPSHDLRRLDDV